MTDIFADLQNKISIQFKSEASNPLFDGKTYYEIVSLDDKSFFSFIDEYISDIDSCSYLSWLSVLPKLLCRYLETSEIAAFNLVEILENVFSNTKDSSLKNEIHRSIERLIGDITHTYSVIDGYYLENETRFKDIAIELLASDEFNTIIHEWLDRHKEYSSLNISVWFCAFFEELYDLDELYFDERRHYSERVIPVIEKYCRGNNRIYLKKHIDRVTSACEHNEIPTDYCERLLKSLNKIH